MKELIYDKARFDYSRLEMNIEGKAYGACSFVLNGMTVQQRVSKITPTKSGQFVAIWKRNKDGKTVPFDYTDDFDFIIITARNDEKLGQFIFPKSILAEKGIITREGKEGKRGIRVYPPWDIVSNKQAEKTQRWQLRFFLTVKNDNTTDIVFLKSLLFNRSSSLFFALFCVNLCELCV